MLILCLLVQVQISKAMRNNTPFAVPLGCVCVCFLWFFRPSPCFPFLFSGGKMASDLSTASTSQRPGIFATHDFPMIFDPDSCDFRIVLFGFWRIWRPKLLETTEALWQPLFDAFIPDPNVLVGFIDWMSHSLSFNPFPYSPWFAEIYHWISWNVDM